MHRGRRGQGAVVAVHTGRRQGWPDLRGVERHRVLYLGLRSETRRLRDPGHVAEHAHRRVDVDLLEVQLAAQQASEHGVGGAGEPSERRRRQLVRHDHVADAHRRQQAAQPAGVAGPGDRQGRRHEPGVVGLRPGPDVAGAGQALGGGVGAVADRRGQRPRGDRKDRGVAQPQDPERARIVAARRLQPRASGRSRHAACPSGRRRSRRRTAAWRAARPAVATTRVAWRQPKR